MRNSSRLWTMVTALANLARTEPPPSPSHRPYHQHPLVAEKESVASSACRNPRPVRRCSPGTSSQLADAPVAMITESAVYSSSPVQRRKGLAERSTRVTSTVEQFRSEAGRLLAEALHHLRAHDPVREAWVVLHVVVIIN